MSSQRKAETFFERALEASPETLYGDVPGAESFDERYVVFEYDELTEDGIDVIPAEQINGILQEGAVNNKEFPLFYGIEASEGYVRKALEHGEDLMTARVRNGEVADTGYIAQEGELKGLMAFDSTN